MALAHCLLHDRSVECFSINWERSVGDGYQRPVLLKLDFYKLPRPERWIGYLRQSTEHDVAEDDIVIE